FQYGAVAGKVVPFTITDADGKITRLQYDSQAHLIYAQTPDERQASFSYDVNGNLIQCIDAAGQAFQYAYDAMANISQLNTAQGPWTFSYEKNVYYIDHETGQPRYNEYKTTIYDPTQDKPQVFGFTTAYPNEESGLYYTLDHRGNKTEYRVTPIVSGSEMNTTTNYYISSMTPPQSSGMNMVTYNYDTSSDPRLRQPASIMNGGIVTYMTYNSQGCPTQIVSRPWFGGFPARTTNFTYASNGLDLTGASVTGQLSSSTTPVTQTLLQSATYNTQHQSTQIVDAAGHTTAFTYTSWGVPQTVTKYEGGVNRSMTYTYGTNGNDLNRLIDVQFNSVNIRTFTYDNSGRVKTETDSRGLTTSYRYNNLDMPIGTYYPDGTNELIDYTCCSLPGLITDRSGRRSYYDYDNLKRLIRSQNADGQTLQFIYDEDSNRTGMMDAKGVWTRWEYDALGRIVNKRYADGRTESTHYDSIGSVDYTINTRGMTNYVHDWTGALASIDYPSTPGPTKDVTMTYDAVGRPLTMTDAIGNTSWTYDSYGRLQSEDGPWPNDSQTYSYDSLNRPSGLNIQRDASSNDVFTYGYDALGRMTSLSATLGSWGSVGTNDTTYNYIGNSATLDYVSLPNNTRRIYGYESGGLQRFNNIQNAAGTNTNLSSFSYSYDNTGVPLGHRDDRVTQTRKYGTETAQTASYSYSQTSMLTGESGATGGSSTPSFALNYSFDAMGNRTQWSDGIAHIRSDATYNRLNQLTGISNYDTTSTPTLSGTSTYSYDNDGNMIGSPVDFGSAMTQFGSTNTGAEDLMPAIRRRALSKL
ncbi:MAG: hypothetical protein EOP49_16985, partial [Sphingobacteriales bacterium]